MERNDLELKRHPVFQELLNDVKTWPRERQEKFVEELRQKAHSEAGTDDSSGRAIS